jgi:hypothetical protein
MRVGGNETMKIVTRLLASAGCIVVGLLWMYFADQVYRTDYADLSAAALTIFLLWLVNRKR